MSSAGHGKRLPLGPMGLSLTAWTLLVLVSTSPYAGLLSHQVIGERGLSPMLTLTLFMTGWLLMNLAMMLPSTLPTLARLQQRRPSFRTFWIIGYLLVWLEVGLIIYGGDLTLHTFLEPRFPMATRWLFPATLFAAGLYEFTPWKRRCLRVCRAFQGTASNPLHTLMNGLRHGLSCVGGCWALMVVMTATGETNLALMLVLGTLIAAEKGSSWGGQLALAFGTLLLGAAIIVSLRVLEGS